MTDSDESTVKVLLKGSMQWMREECNKYREMYDRNRRDLKDEKKKRKAVQLLYHCCYIMSLSSLAKYQSFL